MLPYSEEMVSFITAVLYTEVLMAEVGGIKSVYSHQEVCQQSGLFNYRYQDQDLNLLFQ